MILAFELDDLSVDFLERPRSDVAQSNCCPHIALAKIVDNHARLLLVERINSGCVSAERLVEVDWCFGIRQLFESAPDPSSVITLIVF